jgi:outer membrane receptor protein involved in Fe transport
MHRTRNSAVAPSDRSRLARYAPLAAAITGVLAGVSVGYAAEEKASGGLEEVVVTAQKRAENLQDVPVSIQALGTEKLAELHVVNLDTYVKYLPSVQMSRSNGQGNSGQPGTTHVFMRGVNSGGDGNHSGSQPSVGTYLDEQPVTMIDGTLDIHVYDIARVEVLAGPQGTLYGASSEAGTIRIITNKPDPKAFASGYDLQVNNVAHGSNGYVAEGFVNLPLTSTAAVRLVGWSEHDAGFISNVAGTSVPGSGIVNGVRTYPSWDAANGGNGTIGAGASSNAAFRKDNYNAVDTYGARAQGRITIGDDWTITPGFMGQSMTANGFFGYDPAVGFLKVAHFAPETGSESWTQSSLTVEGKIGNLDMVYAGAYLKRHQLHGADYSDYSFFYDKYYGSGNYFYDNAYHLINPAQQVIGNHNFDKWSHELRFTTPKENALRATFGAFVQRQTHTFYERYYMPGELSTNGPGLADFLSIPGWANTVWLTNQQRVDRDKAIFGEVTYDVNEKLAATVGYRFFKTDNSLEGFYGYSNNFSSRTGLSQCGPLDANGNHVLDANGNPQIASSPWKPNYNPAYETYRPFHGAPCTNLSRDVKQSGSTPRLNVTYKIDPDKMVYATYSRGFRPGGVNRTSAAGIGPYQADYLTNKEIGWKTSWLGHRLRWNGAVFQEDWKDFQFAFLGPNSLTIIVNGGGAKATGIESELQWAATANFTLTANATFLPKDELTVNYCGQVGVTNCPDQVNTYADGSSITGPLAPAGTRMPSSPKFKGNVVGRYEFSLNNWDAYWQAAYVYQTEATQKLRVVDQQHLGPIAAYGIVDLSLGVSKDGTSWDLFINNALDSNADLTRFAQCTETICGQVYSIPVQPRTIGLKFGQRF